MAKWYAGQTSVKVLDEMFQTRGGLEYFGEFGIERLYRDAKIVEIVEGIKEIEKMIIVREFLRRL